MLRALDRGLTVVMALAALALVVLLFTGPELIGAQKAGQAASGADYPSGGGPDGGGGAPAGKALFTASCGSCHTLKAAGTTGSVGPDLDSVGPSAEQVEAVVRSGRGTMPSFEGSMSDADIAAVAAFVAGG